jgi:hypothetical protein
VSPASPVEVALQYWHWNRDRFLPEPDGGGTVELGWSVAAGIGPVASRPATVGGGAPSLVSGSWLLAALDAPDALDRAGAAYALGCAHDEAHGFLPLVGMLDDPSLEVQQAVALGLGELGGARARFALVRLLDDASRMERVRACAALALGVAAGREGAFPGAEIRRAAVTAKELPELREAACAAALLARSDALGELAREWLHSPQAAHAPALAIRCATTGLEAEAAQRFLEPWAQSPSQDLRLAGLAGLVQLPEWAGDSLLRVMQRPDPCQGAMARLVAAGWSQYAARMPAASASLRAVHGLALAVNGRDHGLAGARLAVALAEREDHAADARPVWLLAAGLTGDPSAGARARLVWNEVRSPELSLGIALDVQGLVGGIEMPLVRDAVSMAATPWLRAQAADLCARTARDADFVVLRDAAASTVAPAELEALLVALGRSHRVEAGPILRRHAGGGGAESVRRAAWIGLAQWLRRGGAHPLRRLVECGGHLSVSPWLLEVIDSRR